MVLLRVPTWYSVHPKLGSSPVSDSGPGDTGVIQWVGEARSVEVDISSFLRTLCPDYGYFHNHQQNVPTVERQKVDIF